MKTKDRVLELLNNNNGDFLSGQDIADTIFVTRASVWKAIKTLEKEGYEIEAVTNKGYRLKNVVDKINASDVEAGLKEAGHSISVFYYDEVESTNDSVRALSESEAGNLLVIAGRQTKGRGRRGREFYSPKDSGLYMSLLIRTGENPGKVSAITGVAAVAVATAIDKVVFNGENTTLIKWVNDIFVGDRKVSGILSEAYTFMEDEEANYIIIGIGINVYEPKEGFPKEIKNSAGFLLSKASRGTGVAKMVVENSSILSKLAINVITNLFYFSGRKNESIEIYRSKSNLIGNYVKVNSFRPETKSGRKYAKVLGISDDYHLMIEYEDGTKDELSSGEVSVVKY